MRHRRDDRPARPARRPRGGAGRRRAAGRPHGGRRERHRLRADRDPADRRRGHGAVLLDGHELLRPPRSTADGMASSVRMLVGSGYTPGRRRLRARPGAPLAPLRQAWAPLRGRHERRGGHRVQMRWRDLDGLGHVNHTVVLTYLEEGRDVFLERARHPPRRVRRRPLLGELPAARSIPPSRR